MSTTEESVLEKLDKLAPPSLSQFDAFPKLPSTYKARSESRGFLTIFVALLSILLVLNDVGEWVWGWQHYEFSVDRGKASFMPVNVDILVNMPCQFLSVDLRDALGDRLYLNDGFSRDGTLFDIGQANTLKAHSTALSARQAVSQSRRSQGFFSTIFRSHKAAFRPTYNFKADGRACRIYGSMEVKKVTANLHITTLGHGYASAQHVDHSLMNLSHVINEFSFGPYFPDITQPLDHSFEVTSEPFIAYQYFLSVVPTTYIAPRTTPLRTNQYSVTHYTRVLEHNKGTPGIFFKFDLEPLSLTIHQRTTTFLQFFIRCVGVMGGVWCCIGWALRFGYKAVEVASGADKTPGIVAAETTSVKKKWGGSDLRSRVTRQGHGWVVEGGSPYSSYAGTPVASAFSPSSPQSVHSPMSPFGAPNGTANGGLGLGLGSPSFGPHRPNNISIGRPAGVPSTPTLGTAATAGSPYTARSAFSSSPQTNSPYFPPSPNTNVSSFPSSPVSGPASFPRSPAISQTGLPGPPGPNVMQQLAGPPRRDSSLKQPNGDSKKDD